MYPHLIEWMIENRSQRTMLLMRTTWNTPSFYRHINISLLFITWRSFWNRTHIKNMFLDYHTTPASTSISADCVSVLEKGKIKLSTLKYLFLLSRDSFIFTSINATDTAGAAHKKYANHINTLIKPRLFDLWHYLLRFIDLL